MSVGSRSRKTVAARVGMSNANDIDFDNIDDDAWHGEAADVETVDSPDDEPVVDQGAENGRESSESDGAPSGGAVNWPAVWDNCNVPHDQPLSPTQFAAAVQVADDTGSAGQDDWDRLAREAIDVGSLQKETVVTASPFEDETHTRVRGFWLPQEVRDE